MKENMQLHLQWLGLAPDDDNLENNENNEENKDEGGGDQIGELQTRASRKEDPGIVGDGFSVQRDVKGEDQDSRRLRELP